MMKLLFFVIIVLLIQVNESFCNCCIAEKFDSLKVKIVDVKIDSSIYQCLLEKGELVSMCSGRIILEKGENVGEHSTDDYEEFIIVLVGEGYAENEKGVKTPIKEGQVLYIPPYSNHNIHNEDSKMLMYIYIVSKAYK